MADLQSGLKYGVGECFIISKRSGYQIMNYDFYIPLCF